MGPKSINEFFFSEMLPSDVTPPSFVWFFFCFLFVLSKCFFISLNIRTLVLRPKTPVPAKMYMEEMLQT